MFKLQHTQAFHWLAGQSNIDHHMADSHFFMWVKNDII